MRVRVSESSYLDSYSAELQNHRRTVGGAVGPVDLAEPEDLPGAAELEDRAPCGATKEEVTRACLEAHQTLMNINPANVPKFKEVSQFLAEDLKKLGSVQH